MNEPPIKLDDSQRYPLTLYDVTCSLLAAMTPYAVQFVPEGEANKVNSYLDKTNHPSRFAMADYAGQAVRYLFVKGDNERMGMLETALGKWLSQEPDAGSEIIDVFVLAMTTEYQQELYHDNPQLERDVVDATDSLKLILDQYDKHGVVTQRLEETLLFAKIRADIGLK
jgi:hypothetical protein